MGTTEPAVYIVDDDLSILRSLTRVLSGCGFEVFAYPTAESFLDGHDTDRCGCVILDLLMPEMDGLSLQDKLADCGRPIVFLSGHADLSTGVLAMKAGAVDFLTKPVLQADLLAAVARAIEQDGAQRAARAEYALLRQRLARLTPRERQVFDLVAAGRLNKQVAAELGTAEKTVKVHRARVMTKLGARSVVDLARIADRVGSDSSAWQQLDLRGVAQHPL